MEWYLVDSSHYLGLIGSFPFRTAHRGLMAFYRKQVCDDTIDATRRASLAVTLCKAEGLIRASVQEENELGEQVIVQGAAEGWDHDKLWLLVRAGADIDAPSGTKGMNPLMASAMSGRTSTVRALAELGANIDYENDEGETALMYSSGIGHAEVVKLLAELNADVNHVGKNGSTALMDAACSGNSVVVKLLAELNADVNHARERGTALFAASFLGHAETVRLLVHLKGDINALDSNGQTAATIAAEAGHIDVVALLQESSLVSGHAEED